MKHQVRHFDNHKLLLGLLILGATVLHLLYIANVAGFPSSDSLGAYKIMQVSDEVGILVSPNGYESHIAYPLMFKIGLALHGITGISLRDIALWTPSLLWSNLLLILYYILAVTITKNRKASLLASLLLATTSYFTFEGSTYKAEIFALIFGLAGMIILIRSFSYARAKSIALVVSACLLFTLSIFTHHATPLNILIALSFIVITCLITKKAKLFRGIANPIRLRSLSLVVVFLAVAVGLYWNTIDNSMGKAIKNFAHEIDMPIIVIDSSAGVTTSPPVSVATIPSIAVTVSPPAVVIVSQPIVEDKPLTSFEENYKINPFEIKTVRGLVIYWTFWLFHILALTVLVWALKKRVLSNSILYSLVFLLFTWGIWVIVQSTVVSAGTGLVTSELRLMMLGWLWGYIPLAYVIMTNHNWIRKVGIISIIFGMVFNSSLINAIMPSSSDQQNVSQESDYIVARSVNLTANTATYKSTQNAIYDVQTVYPKRLNDVTASGLGELDFLVIKGGVIEEHYNKGLSSRYREGMLDRLMSIYEGNNSTWELIYSYDGIKVYQDKK